MGIITDLFYAIGNMFQWTFKNLLVPVGYYADWLLFILGCALLAWWCIKLFQFGDENEKKYDGI